MKIFSKFDLFLFDLDGVIYTENKPNPYAKETLNILRSNNKKILFITNNPSKSSRLYSLKLKNMGIECSPNEVITSSLATAYYITKRIKNKENKTAYVIGSQSFKGEIKKTGLKILSGSRAMNANMVIVGGHNKFNYNEIKIATIAIRQGAKFIATNRDPFYPSREGLIPATGALLSSIETASNSKATIMGKPEKYIFQLCFIKSKIKNKKSTLIIGDGLETDILGGINYGISTALVLGGSTTKKELKKSSLKPDFILKNLNSIL